MTSSLTPVHGVKGVHPLVAELEAEGIQVLGLAGDRHKLVQDVVRHAPDLVICDDAQPGDALFKVTQAIAQIAPCPVILFTSVGREPEATAASKLALGLTLVFNLMPVFWLLFLQKIGL